MARPIDPALLQKVAFRQETTEIPVPGLASAQHPHVGCMETKIKRKKRKDNHHGHEGIHIVVQHHYHDHSGDGTEGYTQQQHPARGGVVTPFPLKLHDMLRHLEVDGHNHIISWQPHGRCFVVHKPREFVTLLPKYFKLSKLASFQRQLNLYGFQRLTRGRDRAGYYHELFLRSKPFLAHNIQRLKVKGTGVRARSNPEQEPNFYSMPWVPTEGLSVPTSFMPLPRISSRPAPTPSVVVAPAPSSMNPQSSFETSRKDDFDLVCAFGDKTFHYLDPFQGALQTKATPAPQEGGGEELLSTEAESFFKNFEFPDNIGAEIEEDDIFGDMLEQMMV
jgi:hypothetical protein